MEKVEKMAFVRIRAKGKDADGTATSIRFTFGTKTGKVNASRTGGFFSLEVGSITLDVSEDVFPELITKALLILPAKERAKVLRDVQEALKDPDFGGLDKDEDIPLSELLE